jgi:hypothetical protein
MLSGVSLSADRFFYPNPLESNGQHERSAWFGCACCPSNIARFIPAIPGYIYAVTENELFINLFISNDSEILIGKKKVKISQKANFPWDGRVEISINPEKAVKFDLKIRIPGWAVNEAIPGGLYRFIDRSGEPVKITVNGESVEGPEMINGYAVISRKWKPGDKVEVDFPMPVRKVVADERLKDNADKVAFQRGPVIYCAEWPDNNTGNILDLMINMDESFSTEFLPSVLGGTQVIKTSGYQTKRTLDGNVEMLPEEPVTLIPYALWNNRGAGEMRVWIPSVKEVTQPLPAPTIAYRSKIRASKMNNDLSALNDQIEPTNSNDHSILNYNWGSARNSWEWVEYDFERPVTVSKTKVYWLDNGPDGNFRIPDEWEFLYLEENIWKTLGLKSGTNILKDDWNSIAFKPVRTSSVKIKVKLNRNYSAGIYEWVIE